MFNWGELLGAGGIFGSIIAVFIWHLRRTVNDTKEANESAQQNSGAFLNFLQNLHSSSQEQHKMYATAIQSLTEGDKRNEATLSAVLSEIKTLNVVIGEIKDNRVEDIKMRADERQDMREIIDEVKKMGESVTQIAKRTGEGGS